MIKVQDFARENSITDRQVLRQLKKYENELTGHFERRGQNGTWIDEEACEFLRARMKQQPISISDNKLLQKIEELEQRLDQKEAFLMQKEAYIALLEKAALDKQTYIASMEEKLLRIETATSEQIKQAEDKVKSELQLQHNQELTRIKSEADQKHLQDQQEKQELIRKTEDLQADLIREKSRKLTILERLTGKRIEG